MRFCFQAIDRLLSACIICIPLFHNGYADNFTGHEPKSPPFPDKAHNADVNALPQQGVLSLNRKLREAMTLYYNRQYRLALPILQEVAATDENTQVLFWLGRCAYETGQTQLAIEKYQQILACEPKLSRVRLELAAAYVQGGNKVAARSELQRLLDENPDTALKQQIEQAMLGLEQPQETAATKRFFTAIRASIGPEYDSNVNVGDRDERFSIFPGGNLDGWLIKFNITANSIYDFGDPNGFAWHNHLQFLHHEYPDKTNSNFNYTQTDVYTGLDYYAARFKAKLPFGFIDRRFANKALSQSYYFMPNLEINIQDNVDFALSYRYENEDFVGQYDALNNITHTGSFGSRYKFKAFDAEHSLALFGTYSRRDANNTPKFLGGTWSYDEWSVGPSYFARFKTGTELYLDFKYLNRNYDAPAFYDASNFPIDPAVKNQRNRSDNRYTLTFSLSQTFYKYYFASLSYTYTDNGSNKPLFDYDKNMVGLNFGTNLNF